MQDVSLALAAFAFERSCVFLFGAILQLQPSRNARYVAGLLTAAAILFIGPNIYATPTQVWGLTCASFGCLAAWCILHWTFIEDHARTPSILEVVLSPTRHSLEGVVKVHQRWLGWQAKHSKPAGQAAKQPAATACSSRCLWGLLQEAVTTLFVVHVTYDVGMYLLCSFSNGMCSSNSSSIPAWLGAAPALSAHVGSLSYLAGCAFAFPAGIVLTQQMETIYASIRLGMVLAAFRWPVLGQWAGQMPRRAFNWPVAAGSVSELWGFRWHQFLRFYFEGLGYGMVNAILPKGTAPGALRASMRCVAAFAMSGILHEYLTWAVFNSVTGWHMAFFMLNCVAALLENWAPVVVAACCNKAKASARTSSTTSSSSSSSKGDTCSVIAHVTARVPGKGSKSGSGSSSSGSAVGVNGYRVQAMLPGWLKHTITLSFFILLGPLFVEPYRAAGFFAERAFHPFGELLTPHVLGWLQNATSMAVL